jgi:hypothetical protein
MQVGWSSGGEKPGGRVRNGCQGESLLLRGEMGRWERHSQLVACRCEKKEIRKKDRKGRHRKVSCSPLSPSPPLGRLNGPCSALCTWGQGGTSDCWARLTRGQKLTVVKWLTQIYNQRWAPTTTFTALNICSETLNEECSYNCVQTWSCKLHFVCTDISFLQASDLT